MKKLARFTIIVVVFAFLLAITVIIVKPITRYQTHRAASMYYRHLAAGEFEKSFEYVAYYDRYSDREPQVSYEDARQIWVSRVKEMRRNGLYLTEMERIQILIDDGYPIGKVDATIFDNGAEKSVTQDVHFMRRFGKWRIQGVRSYDELGEPIFALDEAIGGHILTLGSD
ncbi:MAG: hypothetical protein GVY30_00815 [Chloroflexi bacterium]|jgi:hypothetical protein|nr:hypothetical protein [Chloroflexota bacterium]